MADVKFKGTSDFQRVKKDYEELAKKTAKVEQENRNLRKESEKVGNSYRKMNASQNSALSKGVQGVRNLAMQYVGYQAVLAGVTKELELHKRLSEESRMAAQTAAQAESAVVKNIGDVSDTTAKRFIKSTYAVSAQAGMPSAVPTLQAASSVLSATGGNRQMTLDILRTAAPFFRDRPEEMSTFGGALGDVMKVTGGNAKSAAALMLAIQGQARFENLEAFKEVAPALASASVVTRGDRVTNTREAAALFAAIGSRAGDVEGSVTKTAVANLSANLAKVVPDLDTTFQRLAKVQTDPALQEEVLRSGFKGAIKPIIQELVSGADTQTGKMVSDAFEKIVGSEAAFDRKSRQLTGLTENLRVTGAGQRAAGNIEQLLLTPGMATEANARKILTETLDKTSGGVAPGTAWLQNWMFRGYYQLGAYGDTPEEQAANILRIRRSEVAGRMFPGRRRGSITAEERQDLTNIERKMVDLLDKQIRILEQMQSSSKSNANRRAQQLERQGAATE